MTMRKNILMANNNLFIGYRFTHGLRNGSGNFTSPYLNLINGLDRKYSTIQDKSPFLAPIPIEYIRSKTKTTSYYVNITELYNKGIYDINNFIQADTRYTVYIKVRYNEDNYFMAGNQFGFLYSSKINIDELYGTIISRLEEYFTNYNLTDEDIVYIELIFRKFDTKLLSEFL